MIDKNEEHRIVKHLERMDIAGGEAVYDKKSAILWSKVFVFGFIILAIYVNITALDAGTTIAHARTAILTFLGVKIYNYVPDFYDYAEMAGLVKVEDEETMRERLEKRLEELEQEEEQHG